MPHLYLGGALHLLLVFYLLKNLVNFPIKSNGCMIYWESDKKGDGSMDSKEERIVGQVDLIIFDNPRNYYKVVSLKVDPESSPLFLDDHLTITGQMASLQEDTTYEFYGFVTNHPKYGQQFQVSRYQQVRPSSEEGLVDYLSSQRFKGIGPVLAERIVEQIGLNAIDEIIANPTVLNSIQGLRKEVGEALHESLIESQGTERIFMQLNQWGFGPRLSEKIYQQYESKTIEVIRENPYHLVETIDGVGFNKADSLAADLGFESDAQERLIAGLYTAVTQTCQDEGDTYLEEDQTLRKGQYILEKARPDLIDQVALEDALQVALKDRHLVRLDTGIMIPSLYVAETNIARRMKEYMKYEAVDRHAPEEIDQALDQVVKQTGIHYDDSQVAAIKRSLTSPLSIITGGPGTGKTTLINAVIQVHAYLNDYDLGDLAKHPSESPIRLAAPTGRAAKRMEETTGLPAMTIHRLIGYSLGNSFEDFVSQELDGSLLIVDEMSMVDTWLMNWLIQAIPYHMQVILVGDRDQLPSVGPGRVFADMIESQEIATTILKTVYRQEEGSSIVTLAHQIRQGCLPEDLLKKQGDRSFIPRKSGDIIDSIQQIVSLAQAKGYTARTMQVLAPMYKGRAGINQLNQMLQGLLNPPAANKEEYHYFDQIFREGDKVLQLVNNSEDQVYNGDIGEIVEIIPKTMTESKDYEIIVDFDGLSLTYKGTDLNQLTLAYCMSIHKSQGSEYPLVILPMVREYYRMLRRDILYTAVTRAQSSLILLGDPAAYNQAVSQANRIRLTFLKDLLKVAFEEEAKNNSEEARDDQETWDRASLDVKNHENEALVMEEDELYQQTKYILTLDNYLSIDPMIGMDGIQP